MSNQVFFYLALVSFGVFIATGMVWLGQKVYIRLKPLEILDDIECTYWTLENHLRVRWHICDHSGKFAFQAGYSARFKDGQEVDKEGGLKLDFYRGQSDKDCLNGRKWWFEMYVRDIVVNEPDECEITLITKPLGKFWLTKRRKKRVKVLVVKHG